MTTENLDLNIIPSGVKPTVHLSQYDYGRTVVFFMYQGGQKFTPDDGVTATIEGTRADGVAFTASVALSGNTATFTTTVEMANAPGRHNAEMVLKDSTDTRVGSLNFIIYVEPCAMDENSEEIEEDKSLFEQYTSVIALLISDMRADLEDKFPVSIANGGTSATTAAAARAALGITASLFNLPGWEELWSQSATSSGAQSISVDNLDDYDFYMVLFRKDDSVDSQHSTIMYRPDSDTYVEGELSLSFASTSSGTGFIQYRKCWVNTATGVFGFSTGYAWDGENATYSSENVNVPLYLFGCKLGSGDLDGYSLAATDDDSDTSTIYLTEG